LKQFVLTQFASITSIIAGSMMFLTMPWLTIELTGSATMAGLVIAITAIPGLLLSPFMGSLVDSIGRRRMAIIVELITVFTTIAYPILNGITPLTLPLLLLMGVIRALFSGGSMTARKSLLPDVAREANMSLDRANSLHEAFAAAAFATGPAIASLLIAAFDVMAAFWVSAAFMACSAFFAWLIRVEELNEEGAESRGSESWLSYASQGFRLLAKLPAVAIIFVIVIFLALFYIPSELVVLPKYFESIDDPQTLGLLLMVMALATSVGSLLFERFTRYLSYANILRFTALGVAAAMLPMAFLPPTPIMLLCGLVLGFAWGPMPPLLNTVIQKKVPPSMRGRVFSVEMTIWNAAPMITMVFAGAAVDAFGVKPVYLGIAILVLIGSVVASTRKALNDLNEVNPR
jgi:MFS family permease